MPLYEGTEQWLRRALQTLEAFLREANLPEDTGTSSSNALTIEQVLREKETFDLSQNFEKVDIQDDSLGWSVPGLF